MANFACHACGETVLLSFLSFEEKGFGGPKAAAWLKTQGGFRCEDCTGDMCRRCFGTIHEKSGTPYCLDCAIEEVKEWRE